MNIYMKRIFTLFFIIVLLASFSGTTFSVMNENDDEYYIDSFTAAKMMEMQEPALEAYKNLWNCFSKDDIGIPIYDEVYAGEYISGDQLVIMLTSVSAANRSRYLDYCRDVEHVSFVEAKYSLTYLNSLESIASELLMKYDIVSYCVDRKANDFLITVTSDDYSRLAADEIIISGRYPIRIERGQTASVCSQPLWGGDKLINEDTGGWASLGIGGTYLGNNALVTCGHGNEKVGFWWNERYPYIDYFTTRIGQVNFQQANTDPLNYSASSYGDFAFVNLTTTSYYKTNKVWNSIRNGSIAMTGTFSSVPVGTTIYKHGARTYYSWGSVTNIMLTLSYDQYISRGLVQTSMYNSSGTDAVGPGDSGGSVYIFNDSAYNISGIVTARMNPPPGQPARIMYESPIYFAQNAGFTVQLS